MSERLQLLEALVKSGAVGVHLFSIRSKLAKLGIRFVRGLTREPRKEVA